MGNVLHLSIIASVPSTASTAIICLCDIITACPISNLEKLQIALLAILMLWICSKDGLIRVKFSGLLITQSSFLKLNLKLN